MNYIGDFAEDSTIRIVLTTNNGDGAAVAPSTAFEADDFRIYKNGSATQKTTTNGITCTSPFDSVTGLHTLEIDTSNDTGDSGFWTAGADYWVVAVPDETVASQTVVQVIAAFSIENRLRVKSTDQVSLAANATCTKFTDIETDTQDIQTRLPAALVSGRIDASVGAYQAGLAPPTAANNATQVRTELGLTGTLDSAFDAIPTASENGAAGWNRMLVDHTSTGSFGAAVGSLSAAAGSGARTVTVTVNDGTNVLQNATVRMTNGGDSYIAVTNASGVCTFNLDDATWTVGITKSGFSYAGTTLVVDGNETVTYSMTATTITPSDVGLVTGYYTCYTEAGVVESGVVISVKCVRVPDAVGLALDSTTRTATSAANGVAQFANMLPGATYEIKRNSGSWFRVKISEDAEDTVQLNSILGP